MRRELVFIALGFGVAAISGLFLAVQVSSDAMDAAGILLVAGGTFVVAAPLISYGFYGMMTDSQDEPDEPVSMVHQQREFMDVLRSRRQIRIGEMADTLDVSVEDVQRMFHDLVTLGIFSGYVHEDIVYYADPETIRSMSLCFVCQAPITGQADETFSCAGCGTVYYVP